VNKGPRASGGTPCPKLNPSGEGMAKSWQISEPGRAYIAGSAPPLHLARSRIASLEKFANRLLQMRRRNR
jgi:hypothetical protein